MPSRQPLPFHPRRTTLVAPVRVDPHGVTGPSAGEARGDGWRRCARGWYVPADVPRAPEQRIVEAATALPWNGAVTGWAALRWLGAGWFDGRSSDGRSERAVTLAVGGSDIRRQEGFTVSHERLNPTTVMAVDGLRVTTPVRSVAFEMRYARSVREAVVVMDMTAFSDVASIAEVASYLDPHLNGWTGVPQARAALALADENAWSRREVAMRLIWMLDAGFPPPLCNRPIFDRRGNLIGTPDLLDPEAGVAGEYEGAVHFTGTQRARDVAREALFRKHGVECFAVVGVDMSDRWAVAERMDATRRRARWASESERLWTHTPPHWWRQSHTVELRRALTGRDRERVLARQRLLTS